MAPPTTSEDDVFYIVDFRKYATEADVEGLVDRIMIS